MSIEKWDAYDENGKLLGFTINRQDYLMFPDDVYHVVVEVYTVTKRHEVLITQRDSSKPWPLYWEITGGALQAGETPLQGALRELKEETGLAASELIPIYQDTNHLHTLYFCYLNIVEGCETIILQPGETVDFQYIEYNDFKKFILSDYFVDLAAHRFIKYQNRFDKLILAIK